MFKLVDLVVDASPDVIVQGSSRGPVLPPGGGGDEPPTAFRWKDIGDIRFADRRSGGHHQCPVRCDPAFCKAQPNRNWVVQPLFYLAKGLMNASCVLPYSPDVMSTNRTGRRAGRAW